MALNIDTVIGRAEEHCSEKLCTDPASYAKSKETFVIDGEYPFSTFNTYASQSG